MEKISCACSRRKNSIWAHELKSLSPIQEGRSCSFILQERLAYCGVKKKQKKTPKNLAKRVLKRKIWKLSGRLSVFFLQFVQGMKAMRGRGWKLCTHSAGSVTWGPGSSHHSCSTPTYRHRARYIKYARQLQYEQTLANFSAMCCRVGEEHLHRSGSGFYPQGLWNVW